MNRTDSLVVAGQLTMIYAIRCENREMWPHSFTPKHADTSAKNKYKAKKILKISISTVATGRSICCDLFFFLCASIAFDSRRIHEPKIDRPK